MFDVKPQTASIGAEISSVTLKEIVSANDTALHEELVSLLTRHKVLVFRDQHPDPDTHVRLGRVLGELAPIHPLYPKVDSHQDIIIIRNDKDNPPENEVWHADLSFHEAPGYAAILHGVEIPPAGGDTLWVDCEKIAADMSASMLQFLGQLSAYHTMHKGFSFVKVGGQQARSEAFDTVDHDANSAHHPVIRHHPISGAPCLFVNAAFTEKINELSSDESETLLDYLCGLTHNPRYQFRLKWRPGTVAIWDNWSTQHFACGDHFPAKRQMQRVTISRAHEQFLGA